VLHLIDAENVPGNPVGGDLFACHSQTVRGNPGSRFKHIMCVFGNARPCSHEGNNIIRPIWCMSDTVS